VDVLLVEQDETLRGDIAETLTEAGLDVAELTLAEDALALPRAAGVPHILVTDLDLGPGMDGIALAAAAQRRWPALGVIYLSGRPRRDGIGLHGHVLPKPVDGAAVLRVIRDLRESFRAH
jgi:DNA-binding response OmpR family regulator